METNIDHIMLSLNPIPIPALVLIQLIFINLSTSIKQTNRWFRFLPTLNLSMLASTRSWSTSFCAWITLLLLLHIFPDIVLRAKTQKKTKTYSYDTKVSSRKMSYTSDLPDLNSSGYTGASAQRCSWLSLLTCTLLCLLFFNSLLGPVQRLW